MLVPFSDMCVIKTWSFAHDKSDHFLTPFQVLHVSPTNSHLDSNMLKRVKKQVVKHQKHGTQKVGT